MALAGLGQLLTGILEEPIQGLFQGPIFDSGPGGGQLLARRSQHLQANPAACCTAPACILQGQPATAEVMTVSGQTSGLLADLLFQDRNAGVVAIDDLQGRLHVDESSITHRPGA